MTAVSLSSTSTCVSTECFQTAVLKFFDTPNTLSSARVDIKGTQLPCRLGVGVDEFIKAVILRIVRNCHSLRELIFDKSTSSQYSFDLIPWIELLNPVELSELFAKVSILDVVMLGPTMQRSSQSLALQWTKCVSITDSYSKDLLKSLSNIEHLTLTDGVSDEMLQTILQFMVSVEPS